VDAEVGAAERTFDAPDGGGLAAAGAIERTLHRRMSLRAETAADHRPIRVSEGSFAISRSADVGRAGQRMYGDDEAC